MAQTVTFDMYVRSGESWQQYERFIELERDDALETAQKLDQEPGIEGVRIIRVTSFGANRAPLETLEWISPSLRKNASPAKIESRKTSSLPAGIIPDEEQTSDAARKRNHKKKPANKSSRSNAPPFPLRLILKTLAVLVAATAISVTLFAPVRAVIDTVLASNGTTPSLYLEIGAFSICAVFFILLAAIGFYFFVSTEEVAKATAPARPLPKSTENAGLPTSDMKVPEPEPEMRLTTETEVHQVTEPAPQFNPTETGHSPVEEKPDEAAEQDPLNQNHAPIPTTLEEDYRVSMLRFLEGSLSELADVLKTLDQYSRFGIHLFLGGAGDQFGAVHGLNGIQRFILIRETISALGTQPDMVDVFCEKFSDYDQDPTYRFMTEAGRNILDKYLAGDKDCFSSLPDLIKRWRKSSSSVAQAQGIVVIMFTDLVGSTQMTHDHGDMGAQAVVRAHNAIVRNALAQFHGEEVKHTGDGIMASFANAPNALRAAISIQREIQTHNGDNPDLPVRVRIGLNAGDAVREEDDFFGQTVQLAARICDKADENEIYITPSVHELCAGHAFEMSEAGTYELKGIDEPVIAHAVRWQAPPQPEGD